MKITNTKQTSLQQAFGQLRPGDVFWEPSAGVCIKTLNPLGESQAVNLLNGSFRSLIVNSSPVELIEDAELRGSYGAL